jgi:hypothetical protein
MPTAIEKLMSNHEVHSAAEPQPNKRNTSRKARKDRQDKRLNFLGAWDWVAFACFAYLVRQIPLFLITTAAGKFAPAGKHFQRNCTNGSDAPEHASGLICVADFYILKLRDFIVLRGENLLLFARLREIITLPVAALPR